MVLSHFDEAGKARMVDISAKPTTQRYCRVSNRQVKQAYFRAVRNIETSPPQANSWLDPTPSWQPLTVGVHSLRGHPVT